jgi:hypothetical protein
MSNRLTQIATRTGDDGTTGLGDNTRVPKDNLRVCAMGDVDELNSQIGLLLCEDMPGDVRELLVQVQHQLFNLQRPATACAGVHPAGRHSGRVYGPCLPDGGPQSRAVRGRPGRGADLASSAAAVPQPPQRPLVRAGPGPQPDERWRRCVLEQQAPAGANGLLGGSASEPPRVGKLARRPTL